MIVFKIPGLASPYPRCLAMINESECCNLYADLDEERVSTLNVVLKDLLYKVNSVKIMLPATVSLQGSSCF